MLLTIPGLLTAEQAGHFRRHLDEATWEAGEHTAGPVARKVKANRQLPHDSETGRQLGDALLDILARNALFISAALPLKVLPPRFNRYEHGGHYGDHIDNAVLSVPGTGQRLRSDLSATVFLSDPADYEGGELVIADGEGSQAVKLSAGDLLLYPASTLHRVEPVTHGCRLAAFFWVQSMVRDDGERGLLFQLDQTIQHLGRVLPDDPGHARLTGIYHNLVRRWAQT